MKSFKPLLWIDIETTGSTHDNLNILEIAIVITNRRCEIRGEPITMIIKHPAHVYDNVSEWVKDNLSELIEESKKNGITLNQAGNILEELFQSLTGAKTNEELLKCKKLIMLCGSSVWRDRMILLKSFPFLEKYLYPKIIDVTSILLAIKSFNYNALRNKPINTSTHRALDDILSSIQLMKYIGEEFFTNH